MRRGTPLSHTHPRRVWRGVGTEEYFKQKNSRCHLGRQRRHGRLEALKEFEGVGS